MPRIKTIQEEEATGKLKEIYDDLIKKRGKIAEVHKIQSLRPESITAHMDLYMEIMYSRSELSRAQREMAGVVVSATNECRYCIKHHTEALKNYWKDEDKIDKLINGVYDEVLSPGDHALCTFAENLTLHPGTHEKEDHTVRLRDLGFSDSAILDVVLVTAYFNYVNRVVLSLGVELEADAGKGYKY